MLDYLHIVDDIRSTLDSQSVDAVDFLRAAAADYSMACDEANQRLSQCGALLRKGLRSEAIQLCEIEPNLLDAVAILDFTERPEWIETAKRSGIAPPPPMLLDVAAALNEAYALEQPLAALLQRHRLLAMARGSLSERIHILRQLAELDADNPVWQEDLRIFENERLKQIQADVATAERANDVNKLEMLHAELSSPEWKNPPPPEVAKSAGEAHGRLHYWSVQSQLEAISKDFSIAMSCLRVEQGRTLRSCWYDIIAKSGCQPQEYIANRAAPALKWLQEQDEIERQRQDHKAALDALAQAAGHEKSLRQLQELYYNAAKMGAVPSTLEERYQSRLTMLQRTAMRRRRLIYAGLFIGSIATTVIAVMLVSHQLYEDKVITAQTALKNMTERGQYYEAKELVAKAPKNIQQDPRIQELAPSIEKGMADTKKKKTEFSQLLETAQIDLNQLQKQLANKPGQPTLNRLWGDFDHIEKDINRLSTLAGSEEDRSNVVTISNFKSQINEILQRQVDKAFVNQYEDFNSRLIQIENDKQADFKTQNANLNGYRDKLAAWFEVCNHVSSALLKEHSGAIRDRLYNLENSVKLQGQEEHDEKQITAAVGENSSYVKTLQEFIQHNPQSEHTSNFKRVVGESSCWDTIVEWNKVAKQLRQTGILGIKPEVAESQYTLLTDVSERFADCEECQSLRQLLPYVRAIGHRDNEGERIETPLKKLFADPLVADVWMVELEDGRRYYCKTKQDVEKRVDYYINFKGDIQGNHLLPPESAKAKIDRAPQVTVARQIQPILDNLNDANWERSFCQMIAIIHKDQAMDAILKMNLLQQVLQTGANASYCLENAFARHLEWFKQSKINAFANWLEPTQSEINIRNEARRKLENFPDIDGPCKAVEKDLATIKRNRINQYDWIGWLHRTRDGRWECLMKQAPAGTGKLFIVCLQTSGGKSILAPVGQLDRNTTTIDTKSTSALVEGRPIYLAVP
jgi:hypothetical protein